MFHFLKFFNFFSLSRKSKIYVGLTSLISVGFSCLVTVIMAAAKGLTFELEIAILVPALVAPTVSTVLLVIVESLAQTKEKLNLAEKRFLQQQKEVFSLIGHELRTPIAAISMLGQDEDTGPENARQQMAELAYNTLLILEDFRVVLAPEQALEIKEQPGNPVIIIKQVLSFLSILAKMNSIKVQFKSKNYEGDEEFIFHGRSFRQIITNLVKNAVIHSGGKNIYLEFDCEIDANGYGLSTLKVEDDGVGIPEGMRELVFEAHNQGKTGADGSGLGLFIVKELVALMNGNIEYSSSKYGGACFVLEFSMKPSEAQIHLKSDQQSLAGIKLLFVDDDKLLRVLTEKLLLKLGVKVKSCENGQRALEVVQQEDFDLVVTDLNMPEIDGVEFARSLRNLGVTIPIIGLTAALGGEELEVWRNAGANAFISKPVTKENLINTLKSIDFNWP